MAGSRSVLVRPRRGGVAASRLAEFDDDGSFRVFVSFANLDNAKTKNDPEGEVDRFVADLRDMFARVSGRQPGRDFDFFLSSASIAPGETWRSVLSRELSIAHVFVPILSPSFFNSEWCAREWGAFNLRQQRANGPSGPPHGLVIPIRWMACSTLPPVAEGIQISTFDDHDPNRGMRRMMVSSPQRYDEELEELARRLRHTSEHARRPAGASLDIEDAPPAFPVGMRV